MSIFDGPPVTLQHGPIAMHFQVYQHLRAALDQGLLRPGDRLPGERELCTFYGCSMVTIRRALDELTRERRLVRMRGRGTFVSQAPLERNLQLLGSFTAEMLSAGLTPSTRLLQARQQGAPPAVAAALHIDPGSTVVVLERLRLVNGEPLMLEEVSLPASRFPGLLSHDLGQESLYEIMATHYATKLDFAEETIEPVALSQREADLLEQKRGRPALLIELIAFDQQERPVEHCRAIVRGDKARYRVAAHGARAELSVR